MNPLTTGNNFIPVLFKTKEEEEEEEEKKEQRKRPHHCTSWDSFEDSKLFAQEVEK